MSSARGSHGDAGGIVVLAASAGGLEALRHILSQLPADFPLPIAVVLHRPATHPSLLAKILARHTPLHVRELGRDSEPAEAGTVYVAPPDRHLVIDENRCLGLQNGGRIRHVLSSANPLFSTAGHAFRKGTIAVVLTGGDSDATDGVQAVKSVGGTVIAQDEATSKVFGMPRSAIATGAVDLVLPLDEIAPTILRLARAQISPVASAQDGAAKADT